MRTVFVLLVWYFIGTNSILAQSSQFRNYTVKDGLPSSEVYHVMQDSKGYMWFATDHGVCRFNGYEFKTFTTNDGLADNTIFESIEDHKGRIWFRSFSGKLSYYYNDSIYSLAINDTITSILKGFMPTTLSIDSSDNLYMGAHGLSGIVCIDLKKEHDIIMNHLPEQIHYICISKSGLVISGNTITNKIYKIGDTITLVIYSLASHQLRVLNRISWKNQFDYPYSMHDKAIALNDGKIAATIYSRVLLLDSSKTYFSSVLNSMILNISGNSSSNFWIIPNGEAPCLYNNGIINVPTPVNFLKDKGLTSAATDAEGGLWFTSLHHGIYYLNSLYLKTWTKENGLEDDKVCSVLTDTTGSLWATFENNSTISMLHNDAITRRNIIPSLKESTINSLLFNTDKTIWISTTVGIYITSHSGNILVYPPKVAFGFYEMLQNNDNSVWAASYSIIYLVKRFSNATKEEKKIDLQTKIFSICKDTAGTLWIGTLNGLWQYADNLLTYIGGKHPLLRYGINDLKYYNGTLWIATRDKGILVKRKDSLVQITTKNGLLSDFSKCLSMDYKGNIWVGTNKGISHIILNKSGSNKIYDTILNISAPYLIEINKILTNNDTIYAATNNGLTIFNANAIAPNKAPPPIYITDIKINNTKRALSAVFNLPYDENYFTVSFVGLTYKDAGNATYRYKMDGIDTGWIYTKNRDVQYPNLAPGSYTFHVTAMNNDGVWSSHQASIYIHIAHPLWATWWARALYIITIIGFIYWRVRVVENRAKRKAELNKQLVTMELRELKKQIDPHFLFNNLNTLTHLVEIKSDDAPEFVDELSKYYRYSLQFRNTEFTLLDNEIKQAERYLNILKIRFGNHINMTWDIHEDYKKYMVATYSLQLLLENITKHNIISADKPIWVEIKTTHNKSLLVKNQLQVKNSSALSTGHGLKSIEQRYRFLTSKRPVILKTSEYFSVELPLITPSEYESINYREQDKSNGII